MKSDIKATAAKVRYTFTLWITRAIEEGDDLAAHLTPHEQHRLERELIRVVPYRDVDAECIDTAVLNEDGQAIADGSEPAIEALAGYRSLPADTAADWRAVFNFPTTAIVTPTMLDSRYKELARKAHPDMGGSDVAFMHLGRALEFARMEISG